jgi:hypothetical protein
MKIVIVITVVETLMLTLWLAYSYYRGRKPNLRIALGRPGPTIDYRDGSLLSPSPGHWSAINKQRSSCFPSSSVCAQVSSGDV